MSADPFGLDWRRRRAAELRAAGMSRASARAYATAEAKGRARVARMTGVVAAEAGKIAMWNGRPMILINPDLIPGERREAVRQFLFEHLAPVQ